MIRNQVKKIIKQAVKKEAQLEHPSNPEHGDYSTNIALRTKTDPQKIVSALKDNPMFKEITVAGPGFINLVLSEKCLQEELEEIIKSKKDYGQLKIGKNERIQVEFISANPTGPFTVANARGGPLGDVLANVLKKAGFEVEKAYYVNDAGVQITALGHSVLKDKEAVYKGEYIDDLSKKIKESDPNKAGRLAAREIIENFLKKTVEKLNIKYDEWIFESDIYKSGRVDKILSFLKDNGLIYQKEGAQWLKSTKFGDKRDRVLIKSDGNRTYLLGDIALHQYKFEEKKFDKVINIWGTDHHGDVPGLQAGVEAINHKGKLEIILTQMMAIMKKGERQRMSKRAGVYVLMDELLEEVGPDAVRFFFLQRSADTHFNFDVDLAKEQSNKNPVYYVQYAYARMSSILRKTKLAGKTFKGLNHPAEIALIRHLIRFPEIIEDTARDYQVQRLPHYSLNLANAFHKFYEECRVLDDDKELAQARINLVRASQIVLKNSLDVMGVEAPEKM